MKAEVFKEAKNTLALLEKANNNANRHFDKVLTKFIADILYIKGILCYDEFEDIMDARNVDDLDIITEKMFNDEYNPYRRGEGYCTSNRTFEGE